MSRSPSPPEAEAQGPEYTPAERAVAVVIMIVPIIGILIHAAFYVYGLGDHDWLRQYKLSVWMKAVAGLAFINLVGNWFHYRRTRMGLDIASRIATYLWILTIVLLITRL